MKVSEYSQTEKTSASKEQKSHRKLNDLACDITPVFRYEERANAGYKIVFYTFTPVDSVKEARKNRLLHSPAAGVAAYQTDSGYREFWDQGEFQKWEYDYENPMI